MAICLDGACMMMEARTQEPGRLRRGRRGRRRLGLAGDDVACSVADGSATDLNTYQQPQQQPT